MGRSVGQQAADDDDTRFASRCLPSFPYASFFFLLFFLFPLYY